MKSFSEADFLKAYTINHYFCWTYITRPNLFNLDLFCKQSGLNLATFGKNGSNFRKKKYVSVETIKHTCGYQILVLLSLRFCFLSINWTEFSIILVSSNI